MLDFNVSDFKMFEKAPYEKPDPRVFTEIIMDGIKEEEKIIGKVFTTTFIKYALRAVAKLCSVETPKDIKTLDELAEYVISKSDKHPPYYIVIWAQFVTEMKLEGHLGAGERVMEMGIAKRMMKLGKNLKREVETLVNGDLGRVIEKCYQTGVEVKIAPLQMGYKINDDGSIDVLHYGCFLFDGCQMSTYSGLTKRPDGRQVCGLASFECWYLREATGNYWDYTLKVFEKPYCIAKCFMV
jgi:hypothetical protein